MKWLDGLMALSGLTAAELAFLIVSISSLPKITHPRAKKNIANMREKNIIFLMPNHMEQNVLTKRNRFGFKSNLFGNPAVKLARPNASQPNQTWANKGGRAGDERPTSRRIALHILRNDFLWLGHRS